MIFFFKQRKDDLQSFIPLKGTRDKEMFPSTRKNIRIVTRHLTAPVQPQEFIRKKRGRVHPYVLQEHDTSHVFRLTWEPRRPYCV